MKIAIFISGYLRTILYNLKKNKILFDKYDVDYYLHISNQNNKDQYCNNKCSYNDILKIIKPIKVIFEDELNNDNNNLINIRRMWYKIYLLNQLKILEEKRNNFIYDVVIRLRPDVYILENEINLELLNFKEDIIYGITDEFNLGNTSIMNIYSNLFLSFDNILNECKNKNLLKKTDIYLYYINKNKIKCVNNNINHKLVLTLCNIIALAGDSGSGKSTLVKHLQDLFKDNLLQIEGDRYHKWERNHINWKYYTHLNPKANYISKFKNDVFNLKIGNNIYQVNYDHKNGKFTEIEKLENKNNIILCGLHTLYDKNVNNILNLKIFLDTDIKLRYFWKLKRDITNRGYKLEDVLKNIKKRENDFKKFIEPQIKHSDIIINFFTDDNFNYLELDNEPNIYLNIKINKSHNIFEFIELLQVNNINFTFKKDKYINLIFYKIDKNFTEVYKNIIYKYHNNILKETKINYYTMIKAFIIYYNIKQPFV